MQRRVMQGEQIRYRHRRHSQYDAEYHPACLDPAVRRIALPEGQDYANSEDGTLKQVERQRKDHGTPFPQSVAVLHHWSGLGFHLDVPVLLVYLIRAQGLLSRTL